MFHKARVLWYEPRSGKGVLGTEDGREFPFLQPDDGGHLQGGDIVEFRMSGGNGTGVARDIRVVQRCIDHLVSCRGDLAELFHRTVVISAPPRLHL